MKKLGFLFFASAAMLWLAACASDVNEAGGDDGGCSLKGDWKVKTAELTSEKLDSSILGPSKKMTMERKYSFTADSVTIFSGNASEGNYKGVYSVDGVKNLLIINALGSNGAHFQDSLHITACTGAELGLSKRIPSDTTKASIVKTVMTLEKTN
jgi:hypothetical protein